MIWAYLAGVVTLPVLAGIGFGLWVAFSRSNVLAAESACEFCEALGWNLHLPNGAHRLNLTQWIYDRWHRLLARRRLHRELWQMYFAKHPQWIRRGHENAWKKYGTGPLA